MLFISEVLIFYLNFYFRLAWETYSSFSCNARTFIFLKMFYFAYISEGYFP